MSIFNKDEIISIIRDEILNYEDVMEIQETGSVISVGDGIASVYGIDKAMYGENITFENGIKGMVQNIAETQISCILFGDDS